MSQSGGGAFNLLMSSTSDIPIDPSEPVVTPAGIAGECNLELPAVRLITNSSLLLLPDLSCFEWMASYALNVNS